MESDLCTTCQVVADAIVLVIAPKSRDFSRLAELVTASLRGRVPDLTEDRIRKVLGHLREDRRVDKIGGKNLYELTSPRGRRDIPKILARVLDPESKTHRGVAMFYGTDVDVANVHKDLLTAAKARAA
jgi:hypothetical protein